jgi:AraC-like DNA-binding protein
MEIQPTPRAEISAGGAGVGPLTEDLRRVLRTELLRESCSAAGIARLFSMHRRTLHRHLRIEGLAFRQVANEVRFEIACDLLQNTDMALSQVAAVLRYSELSAFTRAFRRWSGDTPSAWRSTHPHVRKTRPPLKSDRLAEAPNASGRGQPVD